MLVGVGVVLYALTSMVHLIVQSEMVAAFGQRRRSRKMSKLQRAFHHLRRRDASART